MSKRLTYAFFIIFLTACICFSIKVIPFSHAEGDFWQNMQGAVQTGHVASIFLPDFYPYLCALVWKPFGTHGIILLQAMMYLGIAILVFLTIRRMTGMERGVAVAAGIIMLDPDLLSSIPKVWDTEITAFFLSALLYLSLLLRSRKLPAVWLTGLVWGMSLSVRPNFALLAMPIGYALWLGYGRSALIRGALIIGLAFATLATANIAAHGSFYLPQNGPYNLFAGANAHTQFALIHNYNAEPSIGPAMADHGFPFQDFYVLSLKPIYTKFALTFIQHHPFEWLCLGAVKLATLLRPDTKAHPLWTGAGVIKLLTSLSTPLWVVLLVLARPLKKVDRLVVLFVVAYTLPFVLTNADPRFRIALDVLVLTHAAVLVLRRYMPPQSSTGILVH